MSPKALRFARLAAEQQPAFATNLSLDTIKQQERAFSETNQSGGAKRLVTVDDDTAAFCLKVIEALLKHPADFETNEWDGNDLAFLQDVARHLSLQLKHSGAEAL